MDKNDIDKNSSLPIFEEKHLVHMWEPFNFHAKKGYDYRRNGILQRIFYYIIRGVVQTILNVYNRFMFGLRIQGRDNIKFLGKKNGGVVICNHVHMLDATIVAGAVGRFRRIYFTSLESNFRIPVIRHLIRGLGGVPIPSNRSSLEEFVLEMEKAIISGDLVCMYPESVLHPYFEGVRGFHKGAFHLAVDTDCPILPLLISFRKPRGLYALYKKKPCITITLLPPINVPKEGTRKEKIIKLRDVCQEKMSKAYSLVEIIPRSGRYKLGYAINRITGKWYSRKFREKGKTKDDN